MKCRTLACIFGLILSAALTSRAQSSSSAGSAALQQTGVQSSPSKKVWTNDDIGDLREASAVSTVGESNSGSTETSPRSPASKGRNAKWYQSQIAKLQAQIPPLDTQIAELQAAIEGKPTGDAKESKRPYGVKADQWPVELDHLQKKRNDIEAHISALEDEARHNGVPPNALP